VEATRRVYFPVAWLPPGHDPDAGGGAATSALQRDCIWTWDILERRRDLRIARGIVRSDATEDGNNNFPNTDPIPFTSLIPFTFRKENGKNRQKFEFGKKLPGLRD
jgi:hypothetical protein